MVKEGTSGWKKGLSLERAYACKEKSVDGKGHHLYRMIVTRQKGLEIVCSAYGRTSHRAWVNAYTALHEKGLMPTAAYDALMATESSVDGE
jgi:hypothetical protein